MIIIFFPIFILLLISLLISLIKMIDQFFMIIIVESNSMLPALEQGDYILILKKWYHPLLRHGQIVLVLPNLTDDTSLYVKRLIGLPGDCVEVDPPRMAQGDIQNYVISPTSRNSNGKDIWHIPSGHIFVKGDFRASLDSRQWGPLPIETIQGIVVARLSIGAKK